MEEEKDREEDRKYVLEVADAFNLRLVGSESYPWPGYLGAGCRAPPRLPTTTPGGRMLSKFKGRIWIDKAELQWVQVNLTAIDTLSFGWVLARIQKGAHLHAEQIRVNDEVWLPQHEQLQVDARLALLKSLREDVEQTYRDYRKFRTDSKVTIIGQHAEP